MIYPLKTEHRKGHGPFLRQSWLPTTPFLRACVLQHPVGLRHSVRLMLQRPVPLLLRRPVRLLLQHPPRMLQQQPVTPTRASRAVACCSILSGCCSTNL